MNFTLVDIKNPFKVGDRRITHINCTIGEKHTLAEYIPPYVAEHLDEYLVNGKHTSLDALSTWIPKDGDIVVFVPAIHGGGGGGGKSVAGMVGLLALTVLSFGVGALVSGVSLGAVLAGTASFTAWGWLAAGAVLWLGGNLISGTAAQPKVDMPAIPETTYGWGKPQPAMLQGGCIPITYGSARIAGQVVSQHIKTVENKQTLNVLLCGGEGPVDSIANVTINDNPLGNFNSVTMDTRLGTNNQSVMSTFSDSYADQAVGYALTESIVEDGKQVGRDIIAQTFMMESGAAQGIEVMIEFPGGLAYVGDDGNPVDETMDLTLQYRLVPDPDVTPVWTSWITHEKITDKTTSALRKNYATGTWLTPGRYEVKATMMRTKDHSTGRYLNKCNWATITAVITDDFIRPNKVLLGIEALATDQLSGGFPTILWTQTRSKVWVYAPYSGGGEC